MAKPKKGVMPAGLKAYWASKGRTNYVKAKKSYRRRGGLKGMIGGTKLLKPIVGAITLVAMKKVIGPNSLLKLDLKEYSPGVQKIAAGFIDSAVGMDNKDLISAGAKEIGATIIDNFTSGRGLGGFGGFGGMNGNGEGI